MKKIFILCLIITTGLIAALLLAPHFFINRYQDRIVDEIYKRTGYIVEFNGDIGLKTFPFLELTLPTFSMALEQKDDTAADTFLSAEYAELRMDMLKAVFAQEIHITHIRIQDPTIDLKQDNEGRWNAIPHQHAEEVTSTATQEVSTDDSSAASEVTSKKLALDSISIINASGTMRMQDGSMIHLKNTSLETGYNTTPVFHKFSFSSDNIRIDDTATGPLSISGQYKVDMPTVTLKDLALQIKNHQFNGSIDVNTASQPTDIVAEIRSKHINIPTLTGTKNTLDSPSSGSPASSRSQNTASAAITLPDVSSVNVKATVISDRLTIKPGADISPLQVSVGTHNNIITTDIAKAGFAGGIIKGTIVAQQPRNTPMFSLKLNAIDINPALIPAAILPEKPPFSGIVNTKADIRLSGKSTDQLLTSSSGVWNIKVNNGEIPANRFTRLITTGKGVVSSIRDGGDLRAALSSDASSSNGKALVFTQAHTSFKLKKGVLNYNNLKIIGNIINIEGKGSIDLPEQQVDMRFTAAASGVKHAKDIAKYVPIIVKGPFSKPVVKPDLSVSIGEALKDPKAAKALLNNIVKDSKGLKDKAGKSLRNLRDSFLNKKNNNSDEDSSEKNNAAPLGGVVDSLFGR